MPWFRVDDNFPYHAKVMAAGNAAVGLWTRAGAWSMQQLTDGYIPAHVVRALGTPSEARRLVEVGLWKPADDGGYVFHEWEGRQPSREQVESERQAARDRQRRAREAAASRRESQAQSRRDSDRSSPVSHGPPDPTRPDPTVLPTEVPPPGAAAEPRATRKRVGTRLPDDFEPSADHHELAASLGVDLPAQMARFRDYWLGEGKVKADWNATLRNWLRRTAEDSRHRPSAPVTRLPRADELELPPDGLSPAEYAAWELGQREKRQGR